MNCENVDQPVSINNAEDDNIDKVMTDSIRTVTSALDDNAENEDTDELMTDTIRTATSAVDDMKQALINILGAEAIALNLAELSTDEENTRINHEEVIVTADDEQDQRSSEDVEEHVPIERPKQKSYVSIKLNNEWFDVLVMSYQPKKTGVHKYWMNVHVFGDADPRSMDARSRMAPCCFTRVSYFPDKTSRVGARCC